MGIWEVLHPAIRANSVCQIFDQSNFARNTGCIAGDTIGMARNMLGRRQKSDQLVMIILQMVLIIMGLQVIYIRFLDSVYVHIHCTS